MAAHFTHFCSEGVATSSMKSKFCFVVSSPMTVAAFLRDQLRELGWRYELSVVANSPSSAFLDELEIAAQFRNVTIERKIRPWGDLQALFSLFFFFRRERFQIIHSVTPKAGLLAMGAAFFARIPIRIHTFTGQVWATKSGPSRFALCFLDKMIACFATHVLVDSFSQREFLIENRVVTPCKSAVLGHGSISGVNLLRFHPNPTARHALREENCISETDVVFLYVGRLNRDKGFPELLRAFEEVTRELSNTWLLIVGPDEESMELLMETSPARHRMVRVGYTDRPELYMAAGDIFVLPSHREGFGSTIIEAAAVGLPSIASRIYGLTDAVVDGQTGILHTTGNVQELSIAMARLASDPTERLQMGNAARMRVQTHFSMTVVTSNTLGFYLTISGD